ncbi:unnamed protein product [Chrysodeixis includens]|uniref:G-patch domain-containing protein n=1 Tax=Chrysodeixis includens TaxID=689277 RepID=A0A9P0BRQ3_CHRIL|nr:unnamed protein product [Chrysodeixis includens]
MSCDQNNGWYGSMPRSQSSGTVVKKQKILNNNTIEQDSDTFCFDELLENLDYNILYLNLLKLLQFLESKQQELCFPFISKKYRTIFETIAQDVNVLKSKKLDESYRDVCNKIIHIMNSNKELSISWTYEFKKEYHKVLVYNKVYTKVIPVEEVVTPLISSTSSSMETLIIPESPSPNSENPDPDMITNEFIKFTLTVILDWIKNTSKFYLTFHKLTMEQVEFIEDIIASVKKEEQYDYLKHREKRLYISLFETVKIFKSQYEITTEALGRALTDNSIVIKKIKKDDNGHYKTCKRQSKENSVEHNIPHPTIRLKTKGQRAKDIEFLQKLSPIIINETLKELIVFLKDEQRASLVLDPATDDQQRFYRLIFSLTSCLYYNFRRQYSPYLKDVVDLLNKYPCEMIRGRKNRFNKITGLRVVTIIKVPAFDYKKPVPRSGSRKSLKKKYVENLSAPPSPTFNRSVKKARLSDSGTSTPSNELEDAKAMPPPLNTEVTKKKSKKSKQKKKRALRAASLSSGICFKPAEGSTAKPPKIVHEVVLGKRNEWPEALTPSTKLKTAKPSQTPGQMNQEMRTLRKRVAQNNELVKALSVPVQSEIAMKMMRDMGWDGGALGARGEGITEPIMPVLKLNAQAGLGHEKSNNQKIKPTQAGHETSDTERTSDNDSNAEEDIIVTKTKQILQSQSFKIIYHCVPNQNTSNINNNTKIQDNKTIENGQDNQHYHINEHNQKNTPKNRKRSRSKSASKQTTYMPTTKEYMPATVKHNMPSVVNQSMPIIVKQNMLTSAIHNTPLISKQKADAVEKIYSDRKNVHLDVLNAILEMLSTNATTKSFVYNVAVGRKPTLFFRRVLKGLADRKMPPFNHYKMPTAHPYIRDILKLYKKMPGVVIAACLPNGKEILLTKITDSRLQMVQEILNRQEKKLETDDLFAEISKAEIMTFLHQVTPPFYEKGSFKEMQLKTLILLKLLFFVISDFEEIIFVCNRPLATKLKESLKTSLNRFNRKCLRSNFTMERALGAEIIARMGDYKFFVTYSCNDRKFAIIKKSQSNEVPIFVKSYTYTFDMDHFIDTKESDTKPKIISINRLVTNNNGHNLQVVINQNKPQANDCDSDYSIASDAESQISTSDYTSNKSSSIASENKVIVNNNFINKPIVHKDVIKNEVDVKTFVPTTSVEDTINNKIKIENNVDEIQPVIIKTEVTPPVNVEVASVVPTMKTEVDCIEDCNIDFNNDLVDYESSDEADSVEEIDSIIDECPIDPAAEIVVIEDDDPVDTVAKIVENNVVVKSETDKENAFDINKQRETDRFKLFNVGLSDKKCDKRHNSDVTVTKESHTGDKMFADISNVYIVPVTFPNECINEMFAEEIQKLISHSILTSRKPELPLLMCHGLQKGALIYTCQDKKSLSWLKSTVSAASHLKVIDGPKVTKMAVKFHCLFDFNVPYLFVMIEKYNPKISTKKWIVEKSEFFDDYVLLIIQMDEKSVNFIHASGLALFVGIDKIEFTLVF